MNKLIATLITGVFTLSATAGFAADAPKTVESAAKTSESRTSAGHPAVGIVCGATAAKVAVTVQAAAMGPVVYGLVAPVVPPQPLMLAML